MSVILRDTFIELHSQDILGKLRQEVRSVLLVFSPSKPLLIIVYIVF
jgi:DNA-directed RNA polymerase